MSFSYIALGALLSQVHVFVGGASEGTPFSTPSSDPESLDVSCDKTS
jgi:hypothetical protein